MFPVFEYEMHVVFSIFSSYDSFQVSFLQTEQEVEPGYPSCGYLVCFWSRCLQRRRWKLLVEGPMIGREAYVNTIGG